jgi:hemerythrin-like metal-binding protein
MIFTHINTAIEKINNTPRISSDSLGLCFSTINAQLRDHFSREELIMRRVEYPKIVQHRENHEQILREFSELVSTEAFDAAIGVVGGWFDEHTLTHDKEFASHLDSTLRREPGV